jgi:folate-binding Fe-S cluster repair protein YgfZ
MRRRILSAATSTASVCSLAASRSVVRVSGADASTYLQGLVTNDVASLEGSEAPSPENGDAFPAAPTPPSSMYTGFLNAKGRMVFEAFISRVGDNDYLLDGASCRRVEGFRSELILQVVCVCVCRTSDE